MDKNRNSMTPLRDVIANLFSHGALPFNPDDATIWKVWDEVVGPSISRNARPCWIKDRKLRVTVSDPIWLQELKFVEAGIKEKLNQKLGRTAVEKIEFRVGRR
jgi:predicted nucleic acid-binding Zn ribbon protein